jgi:uncharacterized membrane protein YgdD (TMEM256/DUF423 family)
MTTQETGRLPRRLIIIGAFGALAVALGALGAHWLKSKVEQGTVTPDQYDGFETAVRYHLFHTIAMLAVVLLQERFRSKFLAAAGMLFTWGIALFSGSLYLLCTRGLWDAGWLTFLGPVTPVGGLCLIAGWIFLSLSAIKR